MQLQIPSPKLNFTRTYEVDGYKVVAETSAFGQILFTLFGPNGQKFGTATSQGIEKVIVDAIPANNFATVLDLTAPISTIENSLKDQIKDAKEENAKLYEPYDDSQFTVSKTPVPGQPDVFSWKLSGPGLGTVDLGTGVTPSFDRVQGLIRQYYPNGSDKKLVGWIIKTNNEGFGGGIQGWIEQKAQTATNTNTTSTTVDNEPKVETAPSPVPVSASTTTTTDQQPGAPSATTTGTTAFELANAEPATGGEQGLKAQAQRQATKQAAYEAPAKKDWRVRLALAPGSKYLYNADQAGILGPLRETDGVVFPYTPTIGVNYSANYESTDLVHTNYKFFQYRNSSIDQISITCDFTAQDANDANYLLAVIHFFRSITKMFYGQDSAKTSVKAGTPPPLCYLYGMGEFQFNAHPLVIAGFNMQLPNDVDYVRTDSQLYLPGQNTTRAATNKNPNTQGSEGRMAGSGLVRGGLRSQPKFSGSTQPNERITYVPSKVSLSISAHPIMTRFDATNKFSLADYATGKLLQGTTLKTGGMW